MHQSGRHEDVEIFIPIGILTPKRGVLADVKLHPSLTIYHKEHKKSTATWITVML